MQGHPTNDQNQLEAGLLGFQVAALAAGHVEISNVPVSFPSLAPRPVLLLMLL